MAITVSTNGQARGFLITKVAPQLETGSRVLYMGDWYLAGGQIEANSRRVLEYEVGELDWNRLALTEEQVEQHNLPVIIKTDRRHADLAEHRAVETEALGQAFIVDLVRDELNWMLPEPLEAVQEREQAQREVLKDYLNQFGAE